MSRKGKQKDKKRQREKEGKQMHDKYPSDTGTVGKTQGSFSNRDAFFQKFGSEPGSKFIKPCPKAPERSAEGSSVPFSGSGGVEVDLSIWAAETPKADYSLGYSREDVEAMEDALAARTPQGGPIPIALEGQMQRAKIPVFDDPLPGQPFNPIVTPADFAGGRTPEDLHYVDGYVTAERGPDGKLCTKYVFDDPVRNLTPGDRALLELGRQMQTAPALLPPPEGQPNQERPPEKDKVKKEKAEDEVSFSDGFHAVVDDPNKDGLSLKGRAQFTNFKVRAREARTILGKREGEEPRIEYLLEVQCGGITKTITLAPHELDNAVKVIQTELPSCIVLPGVQKAHIYISNYIRQQLLNIPQKLYVQRTGFHRINNTWVFAHDHADPPDPNTVFDTGRYIPNCPGISDALACRDSLSWLEISSRDELVIPMYLISFLSVLFKLFQEAGYTVRFLTAVTGRSGSLKTSTTMACYRLYNDDDLTPKASYKDTETALELKMASANGASLVIDDYHPEVTGDRSQNQRGKFESVLRFIGDNLTKSRSNTRLGHAAEFRPSACIVTTAEDLSGSQSALLRCLILRVGLGDINGKKLRRFQENPLLLSSMMYRFASWAGTHGDEIVEMLRRSFPRRAFEGVVTELRLVDTGATLLATAQIVAAYLQSAGAMDSIEAQQFMERCRKAITAAIVASEAMSRDANPVVMYLEAFHALAERGEIRLADNMKAYSAEHHDGYLENGTPNAWIDGKAVYAKVRYYYAKLNTTFPLSETQMAVHLGDAGLISITYETRNGSQKKLYSRKSSLPSRKRMQVIDLERAMAYLEENGNN